MDKNETIERLRSILEDERDNLLLSSCDAIESAISLLESQPEPPQWDNMIDALKQNQLINPAANIAVEYMRNHPNDEPKVVVGFVTSVINGIKEL